MVIYALNANKSNTHSHTGTLLVYKRLLLPHLSFIDFHCVQTKKNVQKSKAIEGKSKIEKNQNNKYEK